MEARNSSDAASEYKLHLGRGSRRRGLRQLTEDNNSGKTPLYHNVA
jgi:hypothetical protein